MPRKKIAIGPRTHVAELAQSELLDQLTGAELVVYLRLVGMTGDKKTTVVDAKNYELHDSPRVARSALSKLEERRLVRVNLDGRAGRTIEVL